MLRHLSVLASAMMIVGCATDVPSWQRYTEKDFPAQVNSLTSRFGHVIDTEHVVTYGTWTVGFGKGKPHASYHCPQDAICHIMISNLRCDRSSGGSAPCGLKLSDDATCKLLIPERQEALQIACPFAVSLKPKNEDDNAKTNDAPPK